MTCYNQMMTNKTLQPVVALDVDGVLNIDDFRAGLSRTTITLKAATWPASPFLRKVRGESEEFEVFFDPAHGVWINQLLAAGVDVVWATTWEAAANEYWSPLLEIPELPVGLSVAANPPRFGDVRRCDSIAWKLMALYDNFAERPFAFIDDNVMWPLTNERWTSDGRELEVPTLSLRPDSRIGLTREHMDKVNAWLKDLGWPVD